MGISPRPADGIGPKGRRGYGRGQWHGSARGRHTAPAWRTARHGATRIRRGRGGRHGTARHGGPAYGGGVARGGGGGGGDGAARGMASPSNRERSAGQPYALVAASGSLETGYCVPFGRQARVAGGHPQ